MKGKRCYLLVFRPMETVSDPLVRFLSQHSDCMMSVCQSQRMKGLRRKMLEEVVVRRAMLLDNPCPTEEMVVLAHHSRWEVETTRRHYQRVEVVEVV